MWLQKLFSSDPSVSMMRVLVFMVAINALMMWDYIVYMRALPMTSQEANLIQWSLGFAISGKAGQSLGEIMVKKNDTKVL
jgi:hypothetical protein